MPIRCTRKSCFFLTVALVVLASRCGNGEKEPAFGPSLSYPLAYTVDQHDTYHGVTIHDPYRWMEDIDSDPVRAWVAAENEVTRDYLSAIPAREKLVARITELWKYEKFGVPVERGGRLFFERNDGLQDQSVLYVLHSFDGDPAVVIDPNGLSEDGTIALSGRAVSPDGRFLAYSLSESGSDWQEWRVRDVDTGRDLPDRLRWVKFTEPSWTPDGEGFFYGRFDEPPEGARYKGTNYFKKLFFHRIGSPQDDDRLVYEDKDHKEWGFDGTVTDDGRYLIISVTLGTKEENAVYYKDLTKPGSPVAKLLDDWDAHYAFIDNDGAVFFFQTDLDAPMGRVIAVDTAHPARRGWREAVPEGPDMLKAVDMIDGKFVAHYLKDGRSLITIVDGDETAAREVALPALGRVSGFSGKRRDRYTFYAVENLTLPATVYRYDMRTGKSELFRRPAVRFDPEAFVMEQVFYESKDGTTIPMFLSHRTGLARRGDNPTYLTGYGGFNIAVTPRFSVGNLVWMEMGGVVAMPSLRGGGEYGRTWHEQGMKVRKQNVFDDFIAAAEWLIANGYTRPARLAIAGGSNGGLLVGACMTQRPELFGACLPAVGVMDMLRFDQFTIGWAWVSDYGSPANPEEFAALHAYSPYHNIKKGTVYPATLITTGDHDDRVFPAHSYKFAARLQASQAGPAPILIRIDAKAGHGKGKPTSKAIAEQADRYAFLVKALDMHLPD